MKKIKCFLIAALFVCAALWFSCDMGNDGETEDEGDFVAVTGISDVPSTVQIGVSLILSGTVAPPNATNKTIVWTVKDAGQPARKLRAIRLPPPPPVG
jgi:hypothetical protein